MNFGNYGGKARQRWLVMKEIEKERQQWLVVIKDIYGVMGWWGWGGAKFFFFLVTQAK